MTATFKGFFGSLVLFLLLSAILGYTGIDIMHRDYAGPFEFPNHFLPFSNKLLNFLDSLTGRVLVWGAIFAVPSFCGILAYRYGHFSFVRDYIVQPGTGLRLVWNQYIFLRQDVLGRLRFSAKKKYVVSLLSGLKLQ